MLKIRKSTNNWRSFLFRERGKVLGIHQTVLLNEAVDALVADVDGFYIDGTFGRGGHSRLILARLSEKGRLLVVDKDPQALAEAAKLAESDSRVLVRHGSFADIDVWCEELGVKGEVAGLLLDLGVSSPQLDEAERGFSFSKDGPLDMRMDTSTGVTAEMWLNSAAETEIADVLFKYGEERRSRRIARAVVSARSEERIASTLRLAGIISKATPSRDRHKHPATRSFQGIRIFINAELDDLERALEFSCDLLQSGGRLVVISFHSLEDRIVKRFINREAKGEVLPRGLPVTGSGASGRLKKIGKAVKAGESEIAENVRARSAIMRIAERMPRSEAA